MIRRGDNIAIKQPCSDGFAENQFALCRTIAKRTWVAQGMMNGATYFAHRKRINGWRGLGKRNHVFLRQTHHVRQHALTNPRRGWFVLQHGLAFVLWCQRLRTFGDVGSAPDVGFNPAVRLQFAVGIMHGQAC